MLLFYLRHGEPTYNPDQLTPNGERQAEALARRLSVYGIDEVYSSSSNRARQTAQPTCEILHRDMIVLDWCNEGHAWNELGVVKENGQRTWGFQHEPTAKLMASREIFELGDEWYRHEAFPKSFEQGIKRIERETDAFLLSLGYRHDREARAYVAEAPSRRRIALFAHQGFGMAFLSAVLDIPYPTVATRFDMQHSGMSVIYFDENKPIVVPRLLQLSNDSHLYRHALSTKYNHEFDI